MMTVLKARKIAHNIRETYDDLPESSRAGFMLGVSIGIKTIGDEDLAREVKKRVSTWYVFDE